MLLLLALVVGPPPGVGASTCADICPGSGACTIGSTKFVEPDSVVDCSGRDITVGNQGTIKVVGGEFLLIADDLTINGPFGLIQAVEGTGEDEEDDHGLSIELTGNLILSGKIRANGEHDGGTIDISVDGDITILENGTDGIEADGTAPSASGGAVTIHADGDILIQDPIHAEGSDAGENGGGSIEVTAGGDVTAELDGHLSALGRNFGGGDVRIEAGGDVNLDEHIDVSGHGNDSSGGEVDIEAGGAIVVQLPLTIRGGVGASGGASAGGTLALDAGCGGVVVDATVDLTSGEAGGGGSDGGAFRVDSMGPVLIDSGGVIDAHSMSNGGPGGAISIRSMSTVTVASNARLDTRGNVSAPTGIGANIVVDACRIAVQPSAVFDASGVAGGNISLIAQDLAPDTGTQPLVVGASSSFNVDGTTADKDGRISLEAFSDRQGECTNDGTLRCWINGDCTVGCQTGTCNYANPSTSGVESQFSAPVTRGHVNGMGASCATVCL